MKPIQTATLAIFFLLGMPTLGICQTVSRDAEVAVSVTPKAIKGILASRRFTLETPFPYTWTKEQLMVSTGVLVVLDVDPAYVIPRNTLEPVLYAGNTPVQRLNHGNRSGHVIGIVPGNIDLASTPIWFGSPELPERVTSSIAVSERELAAKAGVHALSKARIRAVQRPPVVTKDLATLLRTVAADLVLEFSPQEKQLAESWRLPVAKAPSKKAQ